MELQVQSVVASVYFPTNNNSMVYIELSRNWQRDIFCFSSSVNLKNTVLPLCPQLHCVVVKHKVLY